MLTAELVAHYFPKLVELHNYSPAHNSVQKMYNWSTLNQKVRGAACPDAACRSCLHLLGLPPCFELHSRMQPYQTALPAHPLSLQVFKRMGFALAREQFEAVANAEAGAIERVLKLVRTRMARFQEGGSTAGGGCGSGRNSSAAVRQAGGGGAAAAAAVSSSSQPGSPAHYAPRQQQQQQGQGQGQAADHASQAADSIAALRIAAEVPAKLLQQQQGSGGKGAVCLTATAFPTLDQALSASLADKEQQLEELRETNEVGGGCSLMMP